MDSGAVERVGVGEKRRTTDDDRKEKTKREKRDKKTPFSLYDASARAGARTEEVCGKWSAARRAGTHSAARDEAIAELAALEEECD